MSTIVIAERYAQAFFDHVSEDRRDPIDTGLAMIADVLMQDEQMMAFIKSPVIPLAKKEELLDRLIASIEPPEEIAVFLKLLLRKGRIVILKEIVGQLHELISISKKEADLSIFSALPLSNDDRDRIAQKMEAITGMKLAVTVNIDETLIAGI